MSKTVQVFVIKNADGHFYTGDLRLGCPVFSKDKDDAIELDADEVATEMNGDSMPIDAKPELIYQFEGGK